MSLHLDILRRGAEHALSKRDDSLEPGQPGMPPEAALFFCTFMVAVLIMISLDYTVGQLMSSLAMIESPSTTLIDSKAPPPYTDEVELIPADEPAVPETLENKPTVITASILRTRRRLRQVGGFGGRWRGAWYAILYYSSHSVVSNALTHLLGLGLLGAMMVSTFVSLLLCRLHMSWTHAMISTTRQPWFPRGGRSTDFRTLLLPATVYALAEQASAALPLGVAFALRLYGPDSASHNAEVLQSGCPRAIMVLALRHLAVPATYAFVAIALVLPASVTLTRIEAVLLSEDQTTIVPFDKLAVVGDIDVTARGSARPLFKQAWRSFDRASRWRLVKLYIKLWSMQTLVVLTAAALVLLQLFMTGEERMTQILRNLRDAIKNAVADARKQPVDDVVGGN
ncbi:hypothetical protein BDY17DRAFT_326835 [Neohortaea acidophila]|uniref:Uncharacterized protein n=1 Tax=Neohortaea acidophila TaxID=245834 RepID=A0A6A6PJ57_9PEZI|nr:uncharacterized protein BDY17DRAFT_326835 [Neohortaea acidophila]KAF2479826.1 hypothetical protein BDY17DRAFT_326835 [Neohortaea acidophila]